MKRKSLIVLGVLAVAGFGAWFQRLDLALGHVRGRIESAGPAPAAVAWSILGDFADRPELEEFVREQLVATSKAALDGAVPWGFDSAPLLDLTRQVYERQPERVDAAVVAAGLIVECLRRCGSVREYGSLPTFESATWTADVQKSAAFETARRSAAIALGKYVPAASSPSRTESYAALVTAVAASLTNPDPELAAAVTAYVIAAGPDVDKIRWLTAALERFSGTHGPGAAWAKALSKAPMAEPSDTVWSIVVEALRQSPALSDETLANAVVAQCVRRSHPPASVDEACIDLGLAWDGVWAARLRQAASGAQPAADAARALLSAHERERMRTWQSVIAAWRESAPPQSEQGLNPAGGERASAMTAWAYSTALPRHRARDAERLIAGGAPAFSAVAAQYRAAGRPEIINDAAFVLSQGSPQLLSSAVMDRIERFRLLALPADEDWARSDAVNHSVEARRVAVGLLALEGQGSATTRIHPLILALSIPVAEFSKHASDALRRTLDAGEFADALFGFLAVRERYLVSEVNVYRRALISYEGVGPAIERNLAELLATARRPEGVPWILKVIGISALGQVGGASARPLLERYADDTGSYLEISTPIGSTPGMPQTEQKRFDELAACALRAIELHGDLPVTASRPLACARLDND